MSRRAAVSQSGPSAHQDSCGTFRMTPYRQHASHLSGRGVGGENAPANMSAGRGIAVTLSGNCSASTGLSRKFATLPATRPPRKRVRLQQGDKDQSVCRKIAKKTRSARATHAAGPSGSHQTMSSFGASSFRQPLTMPLTPATRPCTSKTFAAARPMRAPPRVDSIGVNGIVNVRARQRRAEGPSCVVPVSGGTKIQLLGP